MNTKIAEDIQNRYRGEQGRFYYNNVFGSRQKVHEVVAQHRKKKFQNLLSPEDTVLEFGAGMGYNLCYLECNRRIAYDLCDSGREICEKAGIEFVTDLDCLQIECANVVICHHVLEHVPEPLNTLITIFKYLKPGGRLLLFVPFETHRYYRKYRADDKNMHLFSWNALTIGNLVTSAGYTINRIAIRPFGYERYLALLAKYSKFAYKAGLWLLRKLRPMNEIVVVAIKPESSTLTKAFCDAA